MAGRTGAGAAAFGFDAGHGIADRILHHGGALIDIEVEARSVKGDDGKFRHQDDFRSFIGDGRIFFR
jgi:hypothetical protein